MGLEIKALDGKATIWLYGDIGESWFSDSITAGEFKEQMLGIKAKDITLRINSAGGDVFDGIAIKALLDQEKANIDVKIDGLAASAASLVAMAGDTIEMAQGSMIMIHDPWTMAIGDSASMRDTADILDKVTVSLAESYAQRSGQSIDLVRDMMKAESWFSADEAVAFGLADSTADAPAIAASVSKHWKYRHCPINPENKAKTSGETAIERGKLTTHRARLKIARN